MEEPGEGTLTPLEEGGGGNIMTVSFRPRTLLTKEDILSNVSLTTACVIPCDSADMVTTALLSHRQKSAGLQTTPQPRTFQHLSQ